MGDKMNIPKEVVLCEVGPRDGLQNEKKLLTVEEKSGINKFMYGCRISE